MEHVKGINQKARRIEGWLADNRSAVGEGSDAPERDVVALQSGPSNDPHFPLGCTLIFAPGWEADSSGGTAGLCQPVERDLFDCHMGCYWPAQVPDQLNYAPDWTGKCAAAQKDWRKIDLIFP